MDEKTKKLLNVVNSIKGNGTFVTSGVRKKIFPGLVIDGFGDLGLPVNEVQVKALKKLSRRAPYGKGRQTITDTAVRSAWEIDGDQIDFQNEAWIKYFKSILREVKKGLGLDDRTVEAEVYKLLIYETGGFFLPHKDSEKADGMFGTLVVGLPSKHTGGALLVRFSGQEEVIDFSETASNYKVPFAAFYADCEHEIKPVTSGFRVCLVFNLLLADTKTKLNTPDFSDVTRNLQIDLEQLKNAFGVQPKALLLGHQYTPANFSINELKGHDRPRAEALLLAAQKANYFATLGLITFYQMGELEGDFYHEYGSYRRGKYWDAEPSGEGTIGDVYEEYLNVEHWSDSEIPGLGKYAIQKQDIIADLKIGEGDPIEKEEEGFTGNAGMTIEYWYHYGAVIFWPKSKHEKVINNVSIPVMLDWMRFYLLNWKDKSVNAENMSKRIFQNIDLSKIKALVFDSLDCSILAEVLVKFDDTKLLKQSTALLAVATPNIKIPAFLKLFKHYDPKLFDPVFQLVSETSDVKVINHLLYILLALKEESIPAIQSFFKNQTKKIPDYISKTKLTKLSARDDFYYFEDGSRKKAISDILEKLLVFASYPKQTKAWTENIFLQFTAKKMSREYVNEVLTPVLLSTNYKDFALFKKLNEIAIIDLEQRTKVKPSPPKNWKRSIPKDNRNKDVWDMLSEFMKSPTQQIFMYKKSQAYRSRVENAIINTSIDLTTETLRQGTPHTLKITKTRAAYKKDLKHWKEDMQLLDRLNNNA